VREHPGIATFVGSGSTTLLAFFRLRYLAEGGGGTHVSKGQAKSSVGRSRTGERGRLQHKSIPLQKPHSLSPFHTYVRASPSRPSTTTLYVESWPQMSIWYANMRIRTTSCTGRSVYVLATVTESARRLKPPRKNLSQSHPPTHTHTRTSPKGLGMTGTGEQKAEEDTRDGQEVDCRVGHVQAILEAGGGFHSDPALCVELVKDVRAVRGAGEQPRARRGGRRRRGGGGG
jgi:hypothetical protein